MVNQIVLYHTYLIDTFNSQFLMVTGGHNGYSLDSTEIFSDNVWKTVTAQLPAPMYGLRVATINNRVLAFGSTIMGFDRAMKQNRNGHVVSVVSYDDYKKWCN